jgi:hypothetical protein
MISDLYAKFYLETHAPTVAEFADVWKNLDREIAEVRYSLCGQLFPESPCRHGRPKHDR